MGARFCLVFFLAKFLSTEDYGVYGIIAAFIGYGLYFIGLDFYTYSTREMISSPSDKLGSMIYSHFILGGVTIIIFSPFLYLFYRGNIFPREYLLVFFLLMILEWLNQELTRILIALKDVLSASIANFIRSAAWVFLLIIFFLIFEVDSYLKFIFIFWFIFDCVALVYLYLRLKKNKIDFNGVCFDWKWVLKGLKVSFLFLIGTLCLRGIGTFDRYYISEVFSYEDVAIYVFFAGIAASLQAVLDAGVFTFLYPKLVHDYKKGDFYNFKRVLRKLSLAVISICFAFSLFLYFSIDIILNLIGKELYKENINILWYCLCFNVIWAVSMVFHYAIYAFKKDKVIVITHVVGLLVFAMLLVLGNRVNDLIIVPLAVTMAFSVILLIKALFFFKIRMVLKKEVENV